MVIAIIGAIIYTLICACDKVEKATLDKAWKTCEEIDWNKYYG